MDFIVIPAYNEEHHIHNVVRETKQSWQNVIVVDDGSKDGTAAAAQQAGALVLHHKLNLGKGAALRTGCDYAVAHGATKIVVLDADGQHEPTEIPRFLEALAQNDILFSYRKSPENMPLVMRFGNWFINQTLFALFQIKVKDSQCGYRAFTAQAYSAIRWSASDYYMETEMVIKAGKKKLRYRELPIETIYRDNYKGTTVIDGVKIVLGSLLWRIGK